MRDLLARVKEGEILVADGAIGTMLLERGLEPGSCPEALNLSEPDILEQIARRYVEAGADIVQSNTFGASPAKLAAHGLGDRAEEINARGVETARRAAEGRAYVCASCGPTGKLLAPYGDMVPSQARSGFELQIRAAAAAGADLIVVETMSDLAEAILALEAAKAVAPSLPAIVTMTFEATPRGFFTFMGVSIERACAKLEEAGADLIGSNCGNGTDAMIEIAREFRKRTRLPLAMQPNAGMPRMQGGRTVYPESPEFMSERIEALVGEGVSVVGGCCGTTPAHTRAIRAAVDRLGGRAKNVTGGPPS